jgi:hypothetical protein
MGRVVGRERELAELGAVLTRQGIPALGPLFPF